MTTSSGDERTFAIAFPFQFTDKSDLAEVPNEVAVNNDIKSVVFISKFGLALFPLGVGIESFIFDPLDQGDQVFLSDQIEEAVIKGVPFARVSQDNIQYNDSQKESLHKVSIAIPYFNLKTGKDSLALLSVPRQGTDR